MFSTKFSTVLFLFYCVYFCQSRKYCLKHLIGCYINSSNSTCSICFVLWWICNTNSFIIFVIYTTKTVFQEKAFTKGKIIFFSTSITHQPTPPTVVSTHAHSSVPVSVNWTYSYKLGLKPGPREAYSPTRALDCASTVTSVAAIGLRWQSRS